MPLVTQRAETHQSRLPISNRLRNGLQRGASHEAGGSSPSTTASQLQHLDVSRNIWRFVRRSKLCANNAPECLRVSGRNCSAATRLTDLCWRFLKTHGDHGENTRVSCNARP